MNREDFGEYLLQHLHECAESPFELTGVTYRDGNYVFHIHTGAHPEFFWFRDMGAEVPDLHGRAVSDYMEALHGAFADRMMELEEEL